MDNNKEQISINVFTAFSGYDSQCMALERLQETFPQFKYKLIGWSEIDEPAIASHNAVFPEAADKNYGDISKVDWNTVPDFDLFTYSSPCLTADQKILTKDGYKPISEIEPGVEVMTKSGEYHKVVEKFDNGMHSTCFVHARHLIKPIHCTYNHKFYTLLKGETEPKFVQVKDLTTEHYLGVPKEHFKMKYVDYNDDTFEMNGFVWFSFTKIEKSDIENVYNIEVETDHSYLVSGCVSANCQDFSRAGIQRGGEKGSGTRSSLLWECERTIREKRPAYCLLENVKALYSDKKFYPLLLRWKDTVNSYGYKSWIQVLNAKDYDVPQGRERVFMVSIREDILEKDFNGADYYFPAPMEPKREITDFLVSHDMIPEEYYLSEHKIPKFLNLINHAGDEFDEALDDEQKEAITAVDRALPGQEKKKDIRQISLENGLGGYVPVKTKENALI